jgi:hypothetical protein
MNLTDLNALVTLYAQRGDISTNLPSFILQAETAINKVVRSTDMITIVTLAESDRDSGSVYNLPTDYLGLRSITGTSNGQSYMLKSVSLTELNSYGTSGTAQVYSIYANKIDFRGSPSVDATFQLIYYAKPAALVSGADTHTLLENHSDIYLSASLVAFHSFTQDLELQQAHDAAFRNKVIEINKLTDEIRGQITTAPSFNFDNGGTM